MAELVDRVVQVAEGLGRKDLADGVQHRSSWVGEESCHNGEGHLVEDKVGGVEPAFVVRHTGEQGFAVVAVYYGACRCLDARTGRLPAGVRKARPACHQERRLQGLRCELHRLKQQGRRSAP